MAGYIAAGVLFPLLGGHQHGVLTVGGGVMSALDRLHSRQPFGVDFHHSQELLSDFLDVFIHWHNNLVDTLGVSVRNDIRGLLVPEL